MYSAGKGSAELHLEVRLFSHLPQFSQNAATQSRMPSKSLVRRWMASCSESYGCSLLGISRTAGDFSVKPSMTGLIFDAICGVHAHEMGTERRASWERNGTAKTQRARPVAPNA